MECKQPCVPQKEDITFLVCGKILEYGQLRTSQCLQSIRRFFPDSKIVLSTWECEPYDTLAGLYDQLVLSKEDQSLLRHPALLGKKSRPNTVNLQQVTGYAGIQQVTTVWCVKTRTDFILYGDDFYQLYVKWSGILDHFDPQYRIFQHRIMAPWLFTENPNQSAIAYMLSDFFQFGATEDLKKLWDGHQEPVEVLDFYTFYNHHHFENPKRYNHRYNVEQCFFMNVLRKTCPAVVLPQWYCDESILQHEEEIKRIYASNFIFGTFRELQLFTRWKEKEAYFKSSCFISQQTLVQWYLRYIERDNWECQQFLEKYPKPNVGRKSILYCIRVIAWYIVPLRVLFHFIKRCIKKIYCSCSR